MQSLTGSWVETNPLAEGGWDDMNFDEEKTRLVNLFTGAVLRPDEDEPGRSSIDENITFLENVGGDRQIINKPYSAIREALRRNGQILDV